MLSFFISILTDWLGYELSVTLDSSVCLSFYIPHLFFVVTQYRGWCVNTTFVLLFVCPLKLHLLVRWSCALQMTNLYRKLVFTLLIFCCCCFACLLLVCCSVLVQWPGGLSSFLRGYLIDMRQNINCWFHFILFLFIWLWIIRFVTYWM